MTGLERRYRRLLALYPADYRTEYEEEMVGVLLASSTSERRRPEFGEALDIIWSAVRVRVTRGWTSLGDTGWTTAMGALGVVGALLLAGKGLRPVVYAVTISQRLDLPLDMEIRTIDWLRAAGWVLLAFVALCRWRVAAAALAWIAVLGEVVLRAEHPDFSARSALELNWPIILVALVAVALTLGVRAPAGARTLGLRRIVLVGLAAAVAALSAASLPLMLTVERTNDRPSDGYFAGAWIPATKLPWTAVPGGVVVGVLLALALTGFAAPLRRRVLTLTTSALMLVVVVNLGLDRAFSNAIYVEPPIIPHDVHLPLAVLAPTFVLLLGVLLVRRRERPRPVLDA